MKFVVLVQSNYELAYCFANTMEQARIHILLSLYEVILWEAQEITFQYTLFTCKMLSL